ncbi:hypothetical protein C8J57DRAFT_1015210, partial [Mycena rebaudengoi]
REITSGGVTLAQLTYWGSYSGLRRVKFSYLAGNGEAESNRLAGVFFEDVLPRHAGSLTELSCPAGYECRWSFGAHNVQLNR